MKGDPFSQDVYSMCKRIPYGRVTTYGLIAQSLGKPQSARLVGWTLNQCPVNIPAHRVVNRLGLLSGKDYFEAPDRMAQMLQSEGISIIKNKIQNFEKVLWIPK